MAIVRRAIKAVVDYFYPPQAGIVLCADGNERHVRPVTDADYYEAFNSVGDVGPRGVAVELFRRRIQRLPRRPDEQTVLRCS